MDALKYCPPVAFSFKNLFLVQEEEDEESASLADVLAALADKWPGAIRFQAADLATLANKNGNWATAESREIATTLREFLFPQIPAEAPVTARGIGKRLKRHVDEPVSHNGRVLILKTGQDTYANTLNFWVVNRDAAA